MYMKYSMPAGKGFSSFSSKIFYTVSWNLNTNLDLYKFITLKANDVNFSLLKTV